MSDMEVNQVAPCASYSFLILTEQREENIAARRRKLIRIKKYYRGGFGYYVYSSYEALFRIRRILAKVDRLRLDCASLVSRLHRVRLLDRTPMVQLQSDAYILSCQKYAEIEVYSCCLKQLLERPSGFTETEERTHGLCTIVYYNE